MVTQREAVEEIRIYLERRNLLILGIEYKKGRVIEVDTSNGLMAFRFGYKFKRIR